MKMEAIRFCSILASVFGEDLDRMTLWDKIGNALVSACSKSPDDIDAFINNCLISIKSDFAKVAANDSLDSIVMLFQSKPTSWHSEFINYISKHNYIILMHSRKRWMEYKEGKIEL